MTRKFNTYTARQNGLCFKISRYTVSAGLFLTKEFTRSALLLCYNVSWSHGALEWRHFLKINVAIKILSARKISYWVRKKIESMEKDKRRCHTPFLTKNIENFLEWKAFQSDLKETSVFKKCLLWSIGVSVN